MSCQGAATRSRSDLCIKTRVREKDVFALEKGVVALERGSGCARSHALWRRIPEERRGEDTGGRVNPSLCCTQARVPSSAALSERRVSISPCCS